MGWHDSGSSELTCGYYHKGPLWRNPSCATLCELLFKGLFADLVQVANLVSCVDLVPLRKSCDEHKKKGVCGFSWAARVFWMA